MGGAQKSDATPLTPIDRSVQRSNRPPGSCPLNRPSSVRQAADGHWRTGEHGAVTPPCIIRLLGSVVVRTSDL